MIVEDQSAVLDFLSNPKSYGPGVRDVERLDTHISAIFLAGDHAYKLKKAVKFPYLDFSTLELRQRYCAAELAVNKRTAPDLYERVLAVTRQSDGAFELGGKGEVVDWLVVMCRFDQAGLFDALAMAGELNDELVDCLAGEIAAFHRVAEPRHLSSSALNIAETLAETSTRLVDHGTDIFDQVVADDLAKRSADIFGQVEGLLNERGAAGWVRHCHGDLHLRNICLFKGRPTLFDAIEFSAAFSNIDILYDLAFLLMDLEHRGLHSHANRLLNGYLGTISSPEDQLRGLAALPLFLSCRAGIRAHTGADSAKSQPQADKAKELFAEARAYLSLAADFLSPPLPRLIAVGGLSGSGKTTLARGLAPELNPRPGAVVLRSDLIRKEMAGADALTRLPPDEYSQESSRQVYDIILKRAGLALGAGYSVITDAVFARPDEREAVCELARNAGVPFSGFWLQTPVAEMTRRLEARARDASDATPEVLLMQLAYELGEITWTRIDSTAKPDAVLAEARRSLV